MNRYMLINRLRWPAVVLLAGIIALLCSLGVIDHFWHWFFPLLLILLGGLMLGERVALASEEGYLPPTYGGAPYPGVPQGQQPATASSPAWTANAAGTASAATEQPGTAMVQAATHEMVKNEDPYGGQL
jgi:hypothetical protein